MVRNFHIYHSFVQDYMWQGQYPGDLGATDQEVKLRVALQINHVASHSKAICRRTHQSHPLGIFYGDDPLDFSFSLILLELASIILITRTINFLLKPLKQPRVVSEIIGGVFIGPSVLGHSKKFTKNVFPDNAQHVISNIGTIGFMFFLFVAGVKLDFSLVRRAGRKHCFMAVIGVIFPILTVCTIGNILRPSIHDEGLSKPSTIGGLATSLSVTAFPVIFLVLKELNLLSSEIGRMAMSTAIVSDLMGLMAILAFDVIRQAQTSSRDVLLYLLSMMVLGSFLVVVVRRVVCWVIEKTPEGKPVDQSVVALILVGVAVIGFLCDMFGTPIANGSLLLGLVIPDGPPLGATLVERSETVVNELLMPFTYAMVGLQADVFAMADFGWWNLAPLILMVITGYLSKLFAILAVALYYKVPFKDSLTLGLILNLRGQFEVMLFLVWLNRKITSIPFYTMLVILTTLMTGICTSLISHIYDPTRPYMANNRRTIQHTPPGTDLGIVVGIPDPECVPGLVNLLELSYPTHSNPFSIYAIHLVELVGRAYPTFIDHDKIQGFSKHIDNDSIHLALKHYQEARQDFVKLHSFTTVTTPRTMYQDVCDLALRNDASLIVLPFRKAGLDNLAGTEIVRHGRGMQSINCNVLAHSPCSVGILVNKDNTSNPIVTQYSFRHVQYPVVLQKYVVLFLGGADCREALAFADRMALNPEVSIKVIRFLSHNSEGDDEREKKLDDGLVTWFWVKNQRNKRVHYREVVVKNGEETLGAICALNDNKVNLYIVGRKQGINPVIIEGLSKWSKNPELGVIGDFVASADFGGTATLLVVHQQVMRR